ncbi:MAG: tetratricopeptide repeat protein [Candidatus Gracilibacteria bacterium]
MKNKLVILGVTGFGISLLATVGILLYPNLSDFVKTNLTQDIRSDGNEIIESNIIEETKNPYLMPKDATSILADTNQNDQKTNFYKGLIFAYQENDTEAKNSFKKALQLSGETEPAIIQNFLNAYSDFELAQNGQRIYLNALLTKAYIDAEEYPMAIEMATKILNEKSSYRDVWILLGYANLKMETYAEAESAFTKAKSIDSVKPEIHYFLGLSRFMQNNWSGAVEELELAILYGFEPKSEAYQKMAESQNSLGNYQDALKAYEYLVNINQSSVGLFSEPIRIAIENVKDLDRALTLANLATTTFPGEALSWSLTAEVYLAKGELDSAENMIDTALGINSAFAKAYYIQGLIKEAKGELTEAKSSYKKAYELSPKADDLSAMSAIKYNALN